MGKSERKNCKSCGMLKIVEDLPQEGSRDFDAPKGNASSVMEPPEYVTPYEGAEPIKVAWTPVKDHQPQVIGYEPVQELKVGTPVLSESPRLNRTGFIPSEDT